MADCGARMMSALASVIDSDDPDEIDAVIEQGIPDPIGTFYRFSLPASLLRCKKRDTAAAAKTNGEGNGAATTASATQAGANS